MDKMARVDQEPVPIGYGMPEPSYGHRVWAGVALLLAGLGLVALGGCFLIGVMLTSNHGFGAQINLPLTAYSIVLIWVLYALAFVSFLCAIVVFVRGMVALLRVMRA
jgi:hypothetical protein